MQTQGHVSARRLFSNAIIRLRESGRALFSPAGIDQSLYSPAPGSRRAVEHSRALRTAAKEQVFSTPFAAVASGDLGHALFALVYRQ
jgi:hypothetical protein